MLRIRCSFLSTFFIGGVRNYKTVCVKGIEPLSLLLRDSLGFCTLSHRIHVIEIMENNRTMKPFSLPCYGEKLQCKKKNENNCTLNVGTGNDNVINFIFLLLLFLLLLLECTHCKVGSETIYRHLYRSLLSLHPIPYTVPLSTK